MMARKLCWNEARILPIFLGNKHPPLPRNIAYTPNKSVLRLRQEFVESDRSDYPVHAAGSKPSGALLRISVLPAYMVHTLGMLRSVPPVDVP